MEDLTLVISYFAYLLPAIVVGLVAYFFFKGHTSNEEGRRRYLIQKEAQKSLLPVRLQAYERLTLFLERIDPNKLLIRVKPYSDDLQEYETLLIQNIDKEYEHNLSQQIYVSPECWNLITATCDDGGSPGAIDLNSGETVTCTFVNQKIQYDIPEFTTLGALVVLAGAFGIRYMKKNK